jgi:hypothetical protein
VHQSTARVHQKIIKGQQTEVRGQAEDTKNEQKRRFSVKNQGFNFQHSTSNAQRPSFRFEADYLNLKEPISSLVFRCSWLEKRQRRETKKNVSPYMHELARPIRNLGDSVEGIGNRKKDKSLKNKEL